jgi:ApaG protein
VSSSQAVTRGVRVEVECHFSEEHSDPREHRWFFIYNIRIKNEGPDTVQLINRHWVITDANGRIEEVRGPGVVGKQPVLKTGESFDYSSGCPLRTRFGSMHGSYEMLVVERGERFDAAVAAFPLRLPGAFN